MSLPPAQAAALEAPPTEAPSRPALTGKAADDAWDSKYGEAYGALPYGLHMVQGPRESMEDSARVVPRGRCGYMCAAVFDGHGGHTAAQFLTQNLYDRISGAIDSTNSAEECTVAEQDVGGTCCPVELTSVLTRSFQDTDSELIAWLQANAKDGEEDSGATATVAMVRTDRLVIANVGDSRAVLSRGGEAVDLSTEHRVLGVTDSVQTEDARVKKAGGWVEDGRVCDILAVSRAFGDRHFKGKGLPELLELGIREEIWDQKFADSVKFTGDPVVATPAVAEVRLRKEDEFLLVATDGLWDVVSSHEAVKIARGLFAKRRTPQEVAISLAETALRRHTEDNVTVCVVDLLSHKADWKDVKITTKWGFKNPFG